VSLAPSEVPGLTLPDSRTAAKAMSTMSGAPAAMPANGGMPIKK
jgi:hypothetical protein